MKNFIIKKWIEPYKLLETIKTFYEYQDYTFDGHNKIEQMQNFLNNLTKDKNNVGLYMKNVNKFYLFHRNEHLDIISELIKTFEFDNEDIEQSANSDRMFTKVDMGKAQAELIIP